MWKLLETNYCTLIQAASCWKPHAAVPLFFTATSSHVPLISLFNQTSLKATLTHCVLTCLSIL